MRYSSYVLFMLAITIVFYFLGYSSVNNILMQRGITFFSITCPPYSDTSSETSASNPYPLICPNTNGLIIIASFILAISFIGVLTFLSGFSAVYVVAMVLLAVSVNFFVFPISSGIFDPNSSIISTILVVIFNTLLVLAVLDFVRGGA